MKPLPSDWREKPRASLARTAWKIRPTRPAGLYAFLDRSQWLPPEEIRAIQLVALQDVLRSATSVPFYQARMREAGLEPDDVRTVEDLRKLPPLERSELQNLGVRGLSVPGARGLHMRSSGSTGRPVTIIWPLHRRAWYDAVDRRAGDWLGIRFGGRRVHIRSHAAFETRRARVNAALLNCKLADAALLSDPAYARKLIASLDQHPPELIEGVSNGLYALAISGLREGASVNPKACWSGGNHLFDHYRDTIESVFRCPVHQRYAAWESGLMAHECTEAHSMHAVAETTLIEVVKPDGSPAGEGELGDVLVTDLRNRAMPLIRYRIGDLAVADNGQPCACGRGLPKLGRLVGRSNELLRRGDGGFVVPNVIGRVMTEAGASILEFQVVQRADCTLAVRVVQRDSPSPEPYRREVATALDELVGIPGAADVVRVERLSTSKAGKLRHIVSEAAL